MTVSSLTVSSLTVSSLKVSSLKVSSLKVTAQETQDGIVFSVKVRAGAKSNEIRGMQHGALRVHVTQAAEKGKANQAIISLLAKTFGVAKSNFEIISGHTQALKKIRLKNLTLDEFADRVQKIMN